jgi:DNA-binding MarR family transcriptional regulator
LNIEVFGTLGFTPQKFLPALRIRDNVHRAVVFHDAHPKAKAALDDIARFCRSVGIPLLAVEVDAFDIVGSAARMQQEIRRAGPASVLFNVTGGTKVLTAAAVLACVLEGVRATYIHEESEEEIPLPLVTARYENILSPPQRRLLRHVATHPGATQSQLVAALGITKPTVSHHVKRLVASGLLRQEPDRHDARRKGLIVIESARLLLGAEAE